MSQRIVLGAVIAGLTAGALLTIAIQQARADGVPTEGALTYTGYLEDPSGNPVEDKVNINIAVYDSLDGDQEVCDKSVTDVTPIKGRFQVELPAECVDAVKATSDLWVEATVGGTPLGRTKLGAVPYALEAATASQAAGALATQLQDIEDDIAGLKARLGAKGTYKYTAGSVQVTTTEWTWISGTAPATLKAGRYWLWNTARVGADACSAGGCTLDFAQIALAPCSRIGTELNLSGAVNIVEPPYTADRLSYAAMATDYFDFHVDTADVELGLCAKRYAANSTYDALIASIYSVTMPQID